MNREGRRQQEIESRWHVPLLQGMLCCLYLEAANVSDDGSSRRPLHGVATNLLIVVVYHSGSVAINTLFFDEFADLIKRMAAFQLQL